MFGDLSGEEVELLNAYSLLGTSGKKELREYIRYLLSKHYKQELKMSIFNNQLLHSLLHSLLHIAEREDFEIIQIEKRVLQFKEIYFAIFEQIHSKYAELVDDLDGCEMVRDFGSNSVENILQACITSNRDAVLFEVVDLSENFYKLSRKKDARKIVAV